MNRNFRKAVSLVALLAMLLAVLSYLPAQAHAEGAPVKITLLHTSDLHGNIYPVDYYTDKADNVGLGIVGAYAKQVRAENPNTLLVDTGDVIQGTPMTTYFNKQTGKDPMADVMSYVGYDVATLGNHEFNFGLDVLKKYTGTANFPIIAANILKDDGTPAFDPYFVKTVQGVKVGFLGLTNQSIPLWEDAAHYAGLHFQSEVEAAKKWVPVLRDTEKVDVVVVLAHSGPEKDLTTGADLVVNTPGESELYALTQVPGVDVIFSGHAHLTINQTTNGVLVMQPYKWGRTIDRADLTLEATGDAAHPWKVTDKVGTTVSTKGMTADPDVLAYAKSYNDTTVSYVKTVVGKSTEELKGDLSQQQDTALMDLVNKIQMETGNADLSVAASLSTAGNIPKGDVTIQNVSSVYIYENYLYTIEVTGQQIKDLMEWSAQYFNQYNFSSDYQLINKSIPGYNFDMLYGPGVTYKIDVAKPVGQRIIGLTYKGKPMSMTKTFKLAINNYRFNGKFPNAKVLYSSSIEIREQIIDYFKNHPNVSAVCDNHFQVVKPDYVTSNHWAKDSIDLLAKNSIVSLDSSSNFNPDKRITRDEFNTMLTAAFGAAPVKSNSGNVSREDAISELLYAAGIPTVTPPNGAFYGYTDANKISPWLARAVYGAMQAGIIKGSNGALRPQEALTRAEAATMIANARFRPISILSTNDVHGYLSDEPGYFGRATTAGYFSQATAKNPNGTLILDAGDSMQGTMVSNMFSGKSIIDAMNSMHYDAAGIGNHEFDWNTTVLKDRINQAVYPVVSANIFEKATGNRPEWAKPYTIVNKNGLKIGVIGFTTTETPTIVLPQNISDYDIKDPVPYVNQYAKQLRAEGAQLIVVIGHEGASGVKSGVVSGPIADLAKQFVGVDAIVGGHIHSNIAGLASGIPFVSNKDKGRGIGNIELRYDVVTGKVVKATEATIVPAANGVAADEVVKAIASKYENEIAPLKSQIIAKTDIDITRSSEAESLAGNLITDIMREITPGVDFAFTNAGGIRTEIPTGDITVGSVWAVMPFDNTLYTMKLTGAQIKDVLEQGLRGSMIQISGMKFEYDSTLPDGQRVTKMTANDGTAIALDKTYTIVTNDFMATGGDSYVTFKSGTEQLNTYRVIREEMISWFKAQTAAGKVIHPVIEGRITKTK